MGRRNANLWLLSAFVATAVVFTLWPGIDLWASGLFFAPGQGFWISDILAVRIVRQILRIAMTLMPVVTLVLWILSLLGYRPWRVPPRLWGFITLLFVIGPLLIVNVGLKDHWGRARPADVTQFGGPLSFTPALRISDQCESNCSFVSGEGAGATAAAISMILLAPYALPGMARRKRQRILRLALIAPAVAIFLRVAMGRHFLSDTVFAILIVLAIAEILSPLAVSAETHPEKPGG